MFKLEAGNSLQRLRSRYRLVIINDDTYEEVGTFKLSRLSVYIVLSTIFVLLTSLTVAIIVFTPMKMYIPGYADSSSTRELKDLKMRTDSLEKAMGYKDQYMINLKAVLQGDATVKLDTTLLKIPDHEKIND